MGRGGQDGHAMVCETGPEPIAGHAFACFGTDSCPVFTGCRCHSDQGQVAHVMWFPKHFRLSLLSLVKTYIFFTRKSLNSNVVCTCNTNTLSTIWSDYEHLATLYLSNFQVTKLV